MKKFLALFLSTTLLSMTGAKAADQKNLSASHLVSDEQLSRFSSYPSSNFKIGLVTSSTDSVEYRQYIDKFSAGSHTFNFSVEQPPCLALVPFLEKREISAFKTLLQLPPTGPFAAPEKLVRYFVEDYRKHYSHNADILECAGTFYINVKEYDFAFHLYDHVQSMGGLSSDGLYNYITHSLLERTADYPSVCKAWGMLQKWQKQFEGSPTVSRITQKELTENPEIICLIQVYNLLFDSINKHPHYYPVLEEVLDFRSQEQTPSLINVAILDSFLSMLKHTPFANYKVGQPVKKARNDYEKVIQKNLVRLTVDHNQSQQILQNTITENIKTILQKDESIKNFLKKHCQKDFQSQDITLNQYKSWARAIITSYREEILMSRVKNLFVLERLLEMNNVELEKRVKEALEQFVKTEKGLS